MFQSVLSNFFVFAALLQFLVTQQWLVYGEMVTCSGTVPMKYRNDAITITDFGGVGDGRTLNTKAFQEAIYRIEHLKRQGGTVLYIPQGVFLTGSFNLTSRMTLYLSKGVVIKATQVGNIGGREFTESLAPDVQKLLVKTMRALQYFPTIEDPNTQNHCFEVLQRVLMGTNVKTVNKNNASHAVLFEALALRVEQPRAKTPINENEIRITTQGRMRNYITYAPTLLQDKGSNEIVLKAMGRAINKNVMIAELIKVLTVFFFFFSQVTNIIYDEFPFSRAGLLVSIRTHLLDQLILPTCESAFGRRPKELLPNLMSHAYLKLLVKMGFVERH